ncbi:MAG: glycosyltransferase [Pseudomonadota bacterium]|nr:glycosyltransferase [Pseudomonadota bacterium]
MNKIKVLLEAPILTQSGYGEHSRLVFESLISNPGLEVYVLPLQWGSTSWISDLNLEVEACVKKMYEYHSMCKSQNRDPEFDVQIRVGIPSEFEKKAPYSVMVTAGIETDRVSWAWILKTHQGIDKIIVPSEHSRETYEGTTYEVQNKNDNTVTEIQCKCPVEVVPYPVKNINPAEINLNLETDFNFLNIGLFGPRKNIEDSVKWFIKEFKDEENVGLVLKTGRSKGTQLDRQHTLEALKKLLEQTPDRKCKVYLLHGNMTEEEIHALYYHPKIKALVTTSHGEGYGLPLFEAAYSGLPVVATDWSGHLDFLTAPVKNKKTGKTKDKKLFANVEYDMKEIPDTAVWENILVKGSRWAYPKEYSFKSELRKVYKNYTLYQSFAKKLQTHLKETHEKSSVLKSMFQALGIDVPPEIEPLKVTIEELPKISVITSIYDGDDFIEEFMEDLTRQTIFEEKCELILIDANSPGNEGEIIMKYKEKFPDNIQYIKLDEDPGIYGVWNHGVKMSTGKFITNANLDDRKAPDSLEKHAKELVRNPNVDLVYADMLITDKPNEKFENNNSQGRRYNFPLFSFDNLKMVNMPHASPMWRRTLHDKYGYFESKYRSAGDWEMWLRAASQGSKFKKINELLGLYYFNPKGISTNPDNFEWKQEEEAEVYEKYVSISLEE